MLKSMLLLFGIILTLSKLSIKVAERNCPFGFECS